MNAKTASEILKDAYTNADATCDLELSYGFDNPYGKLDALRVGDKVFTMEGAEDLGGEPGDGFGYSWGIMVDGVFENESDAQWADTEEEAAKAVTSWIKSVTK